MSRRVMTCLAIGGLMVALLLAGTVGAEETAPAAGEEDLATKLAKLTQSPVANLISVPFQNNFNFGAGSEDRMVWIMNVQPVIPFHISED